MQTKFFKVKGCVICQKCGDEMVMAAITSHPINTRMERQTFLCANCNQTKTFVVPTK
jgi:hypothetical protein